MIWFISGNGLGNRGGRGFWGSTVRMHGSAAPEKEVVVDTTVPEKNITHPTDTKLTHKIIRRCWKLADRNGVKLRRRYRKAVRQEQNSRVLFPNPLGAEIGIVGGEVMNELGRPSGSSLTNFPLLLLATLAALVQGCHTPNSEEIIPQTEVRVDFSDPVLARRQILLFGTIDQQAAERTIQRLLYLEGVGHEPIALYLNTPGGELQHAMAIEQTMRLLQSKVNTYAIGECSSGGAFLLAAGTGKRRAFRGSIIVVHGMTVEGRPPAEFTKLLQDSYTEFWRKRSRLPGPWLPLPPGSLHFLSAEQALEYGLVDEIIER